MAPKLNPVAGAVLGAAPNLKGVSALVAGAREAPNLKPPVGAVEPDSRVVPNLKPVAAGFLLSSVCPAVVAVLSFGVVSDGFFSKTWGAPNLNMGITGALLVIFAPGRGSSHDLHWLSSAELRTMHTPHSHWLLAILNLSPKPWVTGGSVAA